MNLFNEAWILKESAEQKKNPPCKIGKYLNLEKYIHLIQWSILLTKHFFLIHKCFIKLL